MGGTGLAVLLMVIALVMWLLWPRSVPVDQTDARWEAKPLLSDKPPTMVLNAIDFDSLYPPGYTEYDPKKRTRPSTYHYDPDAEDEFTSEPPGCTRDPFTRNTDIGLSNDDPELYNYAAISRTMYPVDDPGGNDEQSSFFALTVFVSDDPTSLDYAKQWYERCAGGKVTWTTTKGGQVIETGTRALEHAVVAPPESTTKDSFALSSRKELSYYALVRGLVVQVDCPPEQKDVGAQLWRTVIIGLQKI
ncbi:hypothetical protein [Mycobacterium sp. DBP42]|uniref:hypothetical protein n=1 Tax=Mycobacterium sp. DBP42 TaxID=2545267 RepID=UPI00110CE31F|nr:hypothetical protein [Mycobacterium sp. DBP42]TMS50860.1 hypothetical protein E0T84_21810 [Mycobacterium sp. DBP42]